MTKISVEIVPRDKEYLLDELNVVKQFKEIDIINIPELLRYDIHSWEGCKIAKQSSNILYFSTEEYAVIGNKNFIKVY